MSRGVYLDQYYMLRCKNGPTMARLAGVTTNVLESLGKLLDIRSMLHIKSIPRSIGQTLKQKPLSLNLGDNVISYGL